MGFEPASTWVGLGAKVGEIIIIGAETFQGVATRLDQWSNSWHSVNITSLRLGIGLDGGIGVAAFFAFNVFNLYAEQGKSITDGASTWPCPARRLASAPSARSWLS